MIFIRQTELSYISTIFPLYYHLDIQPPGTTNLLLIIWSIQTFIRGFSLICLNYKRNYPQSFENETTAINTVFDFCILAQQLLILFNIRAYRTKCVLAVCKL